MADPRSIRTNNPGAMNYGPFAQKWGAIGTDGRLAVFPDRETGFKAMGGLLDTYRDKHGLESVSGIINRWAPRQYDNNSTDNYIRTVSQRLGVDPNMPVPSEKRAALMEAMASYEAGRPVTMGGPSAQPQPIAGGAAPMTPTTPITPYDGMMPADVAKHRKLAQLLAGQATDASPVGHWTQALARVVQGGVGGMHDRAATEGERQGQASVATMMAGNPSPQAMMANPYTMDMGKQLWLAQAKARLDPTAALQAEKLRMEIDEARATGPLRRQKLQSDIEMARTKGTQDQQRMEVLQRLNIDPNSAEGVVFLANGKLPADAYKSMEQDQRKKQAGPKIAEGLENLRKMVDKYDDASFSNAIGPLQGATPDQTNMLTAPFANLARGIGEIANWWEKGKQAPSEVRSNINGAALTLAAAIKPFIRAPGEGAWTDADQAQLNAIVGDLAQASDKQEFLRRLNNVRDRVKANFNIDIPFEAIAETAQPPAQPRQSQAPARPAAPGGFSIRRLD